MTPPPLPAYGSGWTAYNPADDSLHFLWGDEEEFTFHPIGGLILFIGKDSGQIVGGLIEGVSRLYPTASGHLLTPPLEPEESYTITA